MGKGAQKSTQNTSNSGTSTSTNNLSPFARQQAERLFGMGANTGPNALQSQAYRGLGALSAPNYGDARAAFAAAQGSTLTPDKLQPWLDASSPYTKQVTDATRAQFDLSNAQQANQLMGQLAGSGGFGNDRSAVLAATLGGQQAAAQSPILAQIQQQGYDRALSAAGDAAKLGSSTNLAAGYGLGSLDTQQQQAMLQQLQAQLQGGNSEASFPLQQMLGITQGLSGLGSIAGGSTSTTGNSSTEHIQPGPSLLSQILGGAALMGGSGAFGGKDGGQGWLSQAGGGLMSMLGGGGGKGISPLMMFGLASGGRANSAPNHPAVEKFSAIVKGMRELRDGEARGYADGGAPEWPFISDGGPAGLGWLKALMTGAPAADMGFDKGIDPVTGGALPMSGATSGKIQGRVESVPKSPATLKAMSDYTPSTLDASQDSYAGKPWSKSALAALNEKPDPDTVDQPDMRPEKKGLAAMASRVERSSPERSRPAILTPATETAGGDMPVATPAAAVATQPNAGGGLLSALSPSNWNMPLVGLGMGLLTNTTRAGTGEAARSGMQMGLQAHAAEQSAALQAAKLQEEIRQHKAEIGLRERQQMATGLQGELAPMYPSGPQSEADRQAAQDRALKYDERKRTQDARISAQEKNNEAQSQQIRADADMAKKLVDHIDRIDGLANEVKQYLGPGERMGLNSAAAYFKDPKAFAKLQELKSDLFGLVKDQANASFANRVTNGKIQLEQMAKPSEQMTYEALRSRLQVLRRDALATQEKGRALMEQGLDTVRSPDYSPYKEVDKRASKAQPKSETFDIASLPPAAKDTPIGAIALSKDGKPVKRVQGGWEPVAGMGG